MFTQSEGYERFMGRWSRRLAAEYLAFAGVRNGDRVLDVGTGTGALARSVVARFPHTESVGIDRSDAFVAAARHDGDSDRLRFEAGDAQALSFPDGSFDHAMSLLVLNFIPDHREAASEMRRVTRSGGIVSACVWDYGAGMQMLRFFWDEAVALDPDADASDERHMKLSREGELDALWKSAGLANVEEKALTMDQAFASFDDYWLPFTMGVGPAGAYVATLTEERRAALASRLRTRLLGERADGAFCLQARAWCARGEVPPR
jgi:SAM-dependent methyltransferase